MGVNYWAWDFGIPVGTQVLAAHNGVVRMARSDGGGGCCDPSCGPQVNYVIIERGDDTESACRRRWCLRARSSRQETWSA